MEAMQALLKAEQEKTALPQLKAGLARQEANRMRDYVVAICQLICPCRGVVTVAVDAQLIISQARPFERLHGRPEKSDDPEVAEREVEMRYHLVYNRLPKTTACALIMVHLKPGFKSLEGASKTALG